jgi:hypothetical protein
MGEIGEPRREVEFQPLTVPAPPERAPAAPAEPSPGRDPQPAAPPPAVPA